MPFIAIRSAVMTMLRAIDPHEEHGDGIDMMAFETITPGHRQPKSYKAVFRMPTGRHVRVTIMSDQQPDLVRVETVMPHCLQTTVYEDQRWKT